MENGFEWPGLLSALVLAQHADEHRPKRSVLLAVDQELGATVSDPTPVDSKTSRHAGECEFASETDPAVLKVLLKVKDGAGGSYWWVECGACDTGWQVPYYAESVG